MTARLQTTPRHGAVDTLEGGGVIHGTLTGLRAGPVQTSKNSTRIMQRVAPGLGQYQYWLWDEGIETSHGEGLEGVGE